VFTQLLVVHDLQFISIATLGLLHCCVYNDIKLRFTREKMQIEMIKKLIIIWLHFNTGSLFNFRVALLVWSLNDD